MRPVLLLPFFVPVGLAAQFPLPIWESFDGARVVLGQLPASESVPDTLWANGLIPLAVLGLDTVTVDQCCIDPDPAILLARIPQWPTTPSGELLPLFRERLGSDPAAWFRMSEWRSMPDTMIPLSAHPNALVRYVWTAEGLDVQTDHYGTWRSNNVFHISRDRCTVEARDSLKLMRCVPDALHRRDEPEVLGLFVNDKLVAVFHDNSNNTLDASSYFARSPRASIITARHNGLEAIVLSSGEVLVRNPKRWELRYREPSIYRGECDCE